MRALALIGWLACGAAAAQPLPPKEVSPLYIYPATNPPKIVRSFPGEGQTVAAGVLVLTVTFDQAMISTGFDFAPAPGGATPDCLKTPRLLDDKRTFVLLCTIEERRAYAIGFNASPEGGFTNTAERRAAPAVLAFSTNDQEGPRDIHAALKAANLRELDMPIQEGPARP